jgi:hypothetical protein
MIVARRVGPSHAQSSPRVQAAVTTGDLPPPILIQKLCRLSRRKPCSGLTRSFGRDEGRRVEEQPDPTPPTLKDALNVAPGDFAGCLQQAGARRSRVFPLLDDLTWGPCAADPARHDALRRAHWKRIYRSVHPWQRDWLDWLDEIPLLASARLRQQACASKIPMSCGRVALSASPCLRYGP